MATAWTGNGPVTLPPRGLAYAAGAFLFVVAIAGVGLGYRAAWRETSEPGASADQSAGQDDAQTARPIVELPPPVAAPAEAKDENKTDEADENNSKELAAQTAAAQAVQAKPSKPAQNIDDILTSSSEKPPAPVKPAADEAPPPEKTDVPF